MTTTSELKHAPLAVMKSALPRVAAALRRIDRGELDQHALGDVPGVVADFQRSIQDAQFAAGSGGPAAARLAQRGRTAGGVAVISLRGFISPRGSLLSMLLGGGVGGLEGFRSSLREAVDDSDIGSIVLDIDSPGGLVDLVPETAAAIRAAREAKPVTAVANTTAASAAYWLGAQASELVVTPSGEVGSIGVFASHEDWSAYDENMGVKTTLVAAGKYKTEGNPYEPLSEDAQAYMQGVVDELYGMFVTDVAEGRGSTEAAVRGGYGEGRMLLAQAAVSEGMADRVATLEETIARHVAGEPTSGGPTAVSFDQAREALGLPTGLTAADLTSLVAAGAAGDDVATFTFAGREFTAGPLSETQPPPEPVQPPPPADDPPPAAAEVAERRRQALDVLIFD